MLEFIDQINQVYNISGGDSYNVIFGFLVAGYFFLMAIDAKNEVE